MRLAIIGAGVAGLMAARRLRATRPDIEVTIYEKSRGFGGRVATRRREGFAFDHGAQVIKSPSPEIERLLREELPAADLRRMELPVWLFDSSGALVPGDEQLNAEASWYYRDGNNRLGKLLAEGLDVRREVRVGALRRSAGAQWAVVDVSGEEVGVADAVLLTAPAGQCAEILVASEIDGSLKERLAAELAKGTYRRCISVALAYDRPLERPYYALLNADRGHPIAWLGLEHAKGAERCPPGYSLLIAQMAPGWSRERWEAPADAIGPEVAGMLSELLGEELRRPLWWDRQGWRYALPDGGCDFEALNGTGSGLFFAGDFTAGQGRVHLSIESGRRAAELIAALEG
jgi:renalase